MSGFRLYWFRFTNRAEIHSLIQETVMPTAVKADALIHRKTTDLAKL